MEHVNGWCFRGIYKGGLWENDLHVSARLILGYRKSLGDVYKLTINIVSGIVWLCIICSKQK